MRSRSQKFASNSGSPKNIVLAEQIRAGRRYFVAYSDGIEQFVGLTRQHAFEGACRRMAILHGCH